MGWGAYRRGLSFRNYDFPIVVFGHATFDVPGCIDTVVTVGIASFDMSGFTDACGCCFGAAISSMSGLMDEVVGSRHSMFLDVEMRWPLSELRFRSVWNYGGGCCFQKRDVRDICCDRGRDLCCGHRTYLHDHIACDKEASARGAGSLESSLEHSLECSH